MRWSETRVVVVGFAARWSLEDRLTEAIEWFSAHREASPQPLGD